jgi:Arabinofuranosyltransferase N terminal
VNAPNGVPDQPPSNVAVSDQVGAEASVPGQDRPGSQLAVAAGRMVNPSLVALMVWLVCLPVAFVAVRLLRPGDPFDFRTALIPVAAGAAVLVATAVITRRREAEVVSGLAAGLLAGWVAFTMRLALHGTPYGFNGLNSDAARMAGMANRYATAWRSSDGIVPTVPSHYPPLFPWVVGRTAALVHVPAWQLLGPAQTVAMSAAIVAGFALWRRLVLGPVALAVTLMVPLGFSLPEKAYEVLALVVFTPWVLATFGRPPRGQLHWLPAGLIGGLSVALYWGYIAYGALGVAALTVLTWRACSDRRRYLTHIALTLAVTIAVASWYLLPYAAWALMHGTQQMDMYVTVSIEASPLPFLAMTPLAVLEAVGLAGMVWYRRRTWWATPLLLLTLSGYVYRLLYLIIFIVKGHTGSSQDAMRLIGPLLAMAGVLTVVQGAPGLARRLATARPLPSGLPTLGLCVLLGWTAMTLWQTWMPGHTVTSIAATSSPYNYANKNEATGAFSSPLPDGRYPRFSPPGTRDPWFPVDPIEAAVSSVVGPTATPVTLSASELLFAYVRWPGYLAVRDTSAGATTQWFSRYAALARLAKVTNPVTFAARSAHTAFGPIDVFILHRYGSSWIWRPGGSVWEKPVVFSPSQFAGADFAVFTNFPRQLVVAVRRPG